MRIQPRRHFHQELEQLEVHLVDLGERAEHALSRSVALLGSRDEAEAQTVIAGDDEIDAAYLELEQTWLGLLALQTPVARDLRLVSAILHISLHLERVGDMAVNIAKLALVTKHLPQNTRILESLREMGDLARSMLRTAMDAFSRRDLELALQLPKMDDPIDRLNREMYREVVACSSDERLLQWAIRMMIVSRQLERAGDHAVDIGEQVAFLLTGEFQEFTDASHPDDAGS